MLRHQACVFDTKYEPVASICDPGSTLHQQRGIWLVLFERVRCKKAPPGSDESKIVDRASSKGLRIRDRGRVTAEQDSSSTPLVLSCRRVARKCPKPLLIVVLLSR